MWPRLICQPKVMRGRWGTSSDMLGKAPSSGSDLREALEERVELILAEPLARGIAARRRHATPRSVPAPSGAADQRHHRRDQPGEKQPDPPRPPGDDDPGAERG